MKSINQFILKIMVGSINFLKSNLRGHLDLPIFIMYKIPLSTSKID